MIFDVQVRGRHDRVETAAVPDGLLIRTGEQAALVRLEPAVGTQCWRLVVDGHATPVRLHERDGRLIATLGAVRVSTTVRRWLPLPSRERAAAGADRRIEIRAPMPGLVIETRVAAGDPVRAGSPVAIVEAMKMQMEIPAPETGRVEEVRVRAGEEVAGGQLLAIVRPLRARTEGTRP